MDHTLSFGQFIAMMKKNKPTLLIFIILGLFCFSGIIYFTPYSYEACSEIKIKLNPNESNSYQLRMTEQCYTMMKSDFMLKKVVASTNQKLSQPMTLQQMRQSVSFEQQREMDQFIIVTKAKSDASAKVIQTSLVKTIKKQLVQTNKAKRVRVVEKMEVKPVWTIKNLLYVGLICFMTSLSFAIIYLLVQYSHDEIIQNKGRIIYTFHFPIIVSIMHFNVPSLLHDNDSLLSIGSMISKKLKMNRQEPQVICVTAAHDKAGVSTISKAMALNYSQQGYQTLLLSSATGDVPCVPTLTVQSLSHAEKKEWKKEISRMKNVYQYVIIDGGVLFDNTKNRAIYSLCDQLLIVIRESKSTTMQLKALARWVHQHKAASYHFIYNDEKQCDQHIAEQEYYRYYDKSYRK